MASNFAKQWLRTFKVDTLNTLVDLGCLRDRAEYSIQCHYLPKLHTQIINDMLGIEEEVNDLTEILKDSL